MAEGLSQQDREMLAKAILEGRRIPARYQASVLEGASDVELIWEGKTDAVEHIILPFQSVEQIDEPRTEIDQIDSLFSVNPASGRQGGGWANKLIWGDNKLVLSALSGGPMRAAIEAAGGLKLVYIDPPFDVGYDFSLEVNVGEDSVSKEPSVIEQFAYRDTWGRGTDSYLSMLHSRVLAIRNALADDGVLIVHVDYRVSGITRVLLDEVFGSEHLVNEVIWHYRSGGGSKRHFGNKHDTLFIYSKSDRFTFNEDVPQARVPHDAVIPKKWADSFDPRGKIRPDVWDVSRPPNHSNEWVGYPTQKPKALLEIPIAVFTNPGDLVADFFCGSGTTMAVAEEMGRKWIGVDLGRFAIHTSRKRLISIQRERKGQGLPYRSFEILNLGGYEREHFLDRLSNDGSSDKDAGRRREAFVDLVLSAYGAKRVSSLAPFSGSKLQTAIFVGEVDRAVSEIDIETCIDAALDAGLNRVDILGFEFEMGISPLIADRAREKGLTLTLRFIPADVFDARAVKSGAVKFFEVGYLEVLPEVKGLNLRVKLSDFGVFYRQTDADEAASQLKAGASRVVVDGGQVLRISKEKNGTITRVPVTKSWQDWIDYWSVDFNFESKPEVVRHIIDGKETELTTGRFIFENEWQAFRTNKDRTLELETSWHTYAEPGVKKFAVKAIDIFGNDTTKVYSIKVG